MNEKPWREEAIGGKEWREWRTSQAEGRTALGVGRGVPVDRSDRVTQRGRGKIGRSISFVREGIAESSPDRSEEAVDVPGRPHLDLRRRIGSFGE